MIAKTLKVSSLKFDIIEHTNLIAYAIIKELLTKLQTEFDKHDNPLIDTLIEHSIAMMKQVNTEKQRKQMFQDIVVTINKYYSMFLNSSYIQKCWFGLLTTSNSRLIETAIISRISAFDSKYKHSLRKLNDRMSKEFPGFLSKYKDVMLMVGGTVLTIIGLFTGVSEVEIGVMIATRAPAIVGAFSAVTGFIMRMRNNDNVHA